MKLGNVAEFQGLSLTKPELNRFADATVVSKGKREGFELQLEGKTVALPRELAELFRLAPTEAGAEVRQTEAAAAGELSAADSGRLAELLNSAAE